MDHDLSQYIKSYVDKKKITHLNTFLLVNKNYLKQIHEIHSVSTPSTSPVQLENGNSSDRTFTYQKNVILEGTKNIMNLYKKTKTSNNAAKRRKPYLALGNLDCSDNLIDNANKFNRMFHAPLETDSRDLVYIANFHAHWTKTVCCVTVTPNK